jgi:anthranilate phosphoribosyltransferase
VRRKLKVRTIFNVLGPLVNPANPERQIVGVSSEKLLIPVAEALELLGRKGIVLNGSGMDEVSPKYETTAYIVDDGIEKMRLFPSDFGICETEIVPCESSEASARRIRAVFANSGLEEDKKLIAVNFATALYALGFEDLKDNVLIFIEKIEEGEFLRKLEEIACRSTNTSIR